jgi:hypothetical protein
MRASVGIQYVSISRTDPFPTRFCPGIDYTDGQNFFLAGYKLDINDLFTYSWTAVPADLAFEIDYQLVAVPEPSPLALLCLGSLMLRLRNRISRAKPAATI